MNTGLRPASKEVEVSVQSGWLMLVPVLSAYPIGVGLIIASANGGGGASVIIGGVVLLIGIIGSSGFFTLQPNESRVLVLFGDYKGTVRKEGFHWGNPFYSGGATKMTASTDEKGHQVTLQAKRNPRMKVSLRARNLNGERLKVNDKNGNPIEIAAVVVWRVQDTAQAMFDVDDYEDYVSVQAESAVRHLGSQYAYDHGEAHEVTLRSGTEEVTAALQAELQERLSRAGVVVEEARPRSRRPCCAANRPMPCSPPDKRSCRARSAWSRWRSPSLPSVASLSSTPSARLRWSAI
jgi:regulator of protease activity HflC (stomatin/prohibitin superfamily)